LALSRALNEASGAAPPDTPSALQVTSQMSSIWATKIMRSLLHHCNGTQNAQAAACAPLGDDDKGVVEDPDAPAFHGTHDEEFAAFHCLRLVQEFPTNADEVNESAKKCFLEQEENAKDMVCCTATSTSA
jgi:hypothetical protein